MTALILLSMMDIWNFFRPAVSVLSLSLLSVFCIFKYCNSDKMKLSRNSYKALNIMHVLFSCQKKLVTDDIYFYPYMAVQ